MKIKTLSSFMGLLIFFSVWGGFCHADERPSWTIGGTTYYLYRANLHSHTKYSDAKNFGGHDEVNNPWSAYANAARVNLDSKDKDYDNKYEKDKNALLDILAVTDHGGHLGTSNGNMFQVTLTKFNSGDDAVVESNQVWKKDELKGCLLGLEDLAEYAFITGNDDSSGGQTKIFLGGTGHGQSSIFGPNVDFRKLPCSAYIVGEWDALKAEASSFNQLSDKDMQPFHRKQYGNSKDRFVALYGFEWTDGADFDVLSVGREHAGHVNVLNSRNYCDTWTWGNGRLTSNDENYKTKDRSDQTSNLDDFYKWIGRQIASGDDVICQFNHPSLYDNSSHFNHFLTSGVSSEVLNHFALIELGADGRTFLDPNNPDHHVQSTYEGGGDGRNPNTSNEYWFRQALWHGWRVSPTNNGDNHAGGYADEPQRTGVWVAGDANASSDQILDALRDRKTFSTEVTDAVVTFSGGINGSLSVPMGGSFTVEQGTRVLFEPEVTLPGKTFTGHIDVVAVKTPASDGKEVSYQVKSLPSYKNYLFIDAPDSNTCYYARISIGGKMAYSAPIWVKVNLPTPHYTPPSIQKTSVPAPVIVIDRSGSLQDETGVMQQVENKATDVVNAIRNTVGAAAVVNFSGRDNAHIDASFTQNTAVLLRAIQYPTGINNGTALYDALETAAQLAQGRRAMLIVLTDGKDFTSRTSLNSVIEFCSRRSVPMVIIGFTGTGGRDEDGLKRMALSTGGFYVQNEKANIQDILHRFYQYSQYKSKTRPREMPN